MIVIAGLVLGAIGGALRARSRGGKPLDQAQYATGYGIAFGLVGMFVTIALERAM